MIDMLKNRDYMWSTNDTIRRRGRSSAGFTLAELLIVVAILGVLAGVSFIAVQNHQKSLTQSQYDTIAKEIFVAAQNHLTLAKSENYQDTADLIHNRGTAGNAEADKVEPKGSDGFNTDVFFFTSSDFTSNGSSILDQMLPFGSIELITGGSFIIRYQPNAARVLDVFYWTNDRRYGIDSVDYKKAVDKYRDVDGSNKKTNRASYEGKGILGWFGGEGLVATGEYLNAPEIEVINAEMLLVKVTDTNVNDEKKKPLNPCLKLIITGETSKAKAAIPLTRVETRVLSNQARTQTRGYY